jgi:soluble lytic murein transglycosylase
VLPRHLNLRRALAAGAFVVALSLGVSTRESEQLAPTAHAPLPERASDLWFVPAAADAESKTATTYRPLAEGVAAYRDGKYDLALRLVSRPSLASSALAHYSSYYEGLSLLGLSRADDARRVLKALDSKKPAGYLSVAVPLAIGEAAEAVEDHADAAATYQRLAANRNVVSEEVLSRLGRAALAMGDRQKAAEAFLRVYYEFPLTDGATTAASQLGSLQDLITRTGYTADMGRAQQLFGARRYAEARSAFQDLQRLAAGGDREIADLRVAESDFYLKRYAAARDGTRPYLQRGSHQAEARFFHAGALRELGDHDEYGAMTRELVKAFPDSPWAEQALDALGTHFILENEDETAAEVFKELYDRYPAGSRADRAAWKYGWWSYKTEDYAEAIRVFESAAETFPRSDYRPSWLYWAARSHGKLGNAGQLQARLRLVYTDYANSYYGRLAEKKLSQRAGATRFQDHVVPVKHDPVPPRPDLSNETTIRLLLAHGMYDDALEELRYAQRLHGSSPGIDATMAWAYHQKGDLRRAISIMRRAYPQFLAAGQPLPVEILRVIFPLAYWDLIKRHATARGLDPFLVAALIAQESTFDPKARSVANAWGLMQIVPATGRRLARAVGIRRFSTSMLTNPETNIRLGTLHFARLVRQFGGAHFALASYNAGENRVTRWKAERPGIEQDEFIDDIPFPETQNYVKRILGTAEDYRSLYGSGGTAAPKAPATKSPPRKR